MSKKGKVKNGNNKAKHTKLLNQKKNKVKNAKLQNKIRLKEIVARSKVQLQNCPCGSGKLYQDCCAIAHQNSTDVKTAEQLMRARYTAFTMGNIEYLMESHHSTTQPLKEKQEILDWAKSVEWQRLEILNVTEDTVEFKAYFNENGTDEYLHENSKFVKENGVWMYLGMA